ncbi:MAG: ABC transporter permease, partial [Bacteroides sp.]|nr:ABC transporter permease [Bacteroides sp.]
MIKQYITQAIAQLRQHPIISAVSIIGTALAIFLIMLVVMMQQVKTAPFAPESNRDRFLHVHFMSLRIKNSNGNGESNQPMSERTIKELYQSLKTPETVTIYT